MKMECWIIKEMQKGKAIFNKEGTSSIARKQLMNAIDDKRTVYLGVGDESMTFSPTTEGNPMPGEWRIQFSRKQIMGFAEDWQGDERYKYTVMNVGIVGFHELIHFNTQYADNESGDRNLPLSTWTPGIVVRQENAIRKQLGELYLQRLNYSGSGGGYNYVFFSPENIPLNDIKKAIRLNRMTPEYEYSNPGNYIKTYVGKSASRIGRE